MNYSKILSSTLFATSISLFSTLVIGSDKVKAGACPDPSGFANANAWAGAVGGSCRSTPEEYGVTVYRMGFCTENPGASIAAGSAPVTSSCTFTYENTSGESKSFAAGGTSSLSETYTSAPAVGTYPYAVIEIAPTFDIKGSYGPLADGKTYYTNGTAGSTTTNSAQYATTAAPLDTFFGPAGQDWCVATGSANVTGGSINAYLLDLNGKLIADNNLVNKCSGVNKLFGVMSLDSSVVISSATTGLTATFTVTNNGSTVYYIPGAGGGAPGSIGHDSGPFSVTFSTVE